MVYKQLDYSKRCRIYGLWKAGLNQIEIAKELGVNKSTIIRELNRNVTLVHTALGSWHYKPDYVQGYSQSRPKKKPKRIKFTKEVKQFVCDKMRANWSPEQISGYAKRHKLFSISHERIYQFILADKAEGGQLYQHLRHQHKKYRRLYSSFNRQGPIKDRGMIDERSNIVDEKKRLGDWEIDTIIDKGHQKAIATLVERESKKTLIGQVGTKKADDVSAQIIRLLDEIKPYVLTITADNVVSLRNRN